MPSNLIEIEIPVGSLADVLKPQDTRPVGRGATRMVPNVPLGNNNFLPCIIQSKTVVAVDCDGNALPDPSVECLLLVSRNPYTTLRAYIAVAALKQFDVVPVEW